MKHKITTELELCEISNMCMEAEKRKKLKIFLKDKSIITGFFYGFTKAVDNEPEIAEIDIELENGQLTGAFQDEIASIEVLE